MELSVNIEDARQTEVEALLRLSDQVAEALYPGAYRRPLNPQTLSAPHISLFVARTGDRIAAGCCALFDNDDGTAEMKRMIVDPRFRQSGVGQALLQAVEATASLRGMDRLLMEVGTRNTDGQALYLRAGYTQRGPFGSYQPSPISLFFEKVIG
ncbi:GNAT family N-acetyltransferase [Agrobacterium sp. a22-2]|uniref:GNAT family N-acetyltransferase n=1 Tax=Agrobacterium sp. a22-2 TaxID=2283840 RepID=UPI001FEFEE0B|nr:GNAT family N-acetyltransferase [Agrobacterium sp. a22-2]